MKSIVWIAAVVLSILAAAAAHAQSTVYTWTDAKGKLYITDEPPPADANVKDIVESAPMAPAEVRQNELQRQRRSEKRLEEQRGSETEEVLRRAREADEQAREAIRRSDEQAQQALDYRKHFGNTPSRREQFKYKIREEDQKAEAARTEAQKAIDRAKAATEEARTAINQSQPGAKP
jgi:membrane protein involved in colicin uptake